MDTLKPIAGTLVFNERTVWMIVRSEFRSQNRELMHLSYCLDHFDTSIIGTMFWFDSATWAVSQRIC